jgi:MFS family permease
VLGHIGDRFGRKRVLVATIVLMGASTFAIGCLPSYGAAGALAPVLLVIARLLQGFSAGGEQAGASSMSLEHAPDDRRAFFTSFTLSGTQGGMIVATAVFLPFAALPRDELLAWGWRVPFWLSLVVVVAGVLIRRTLDETPVFAAEAEGAGSARKDGPPITVLFRHHWAAVLRVVLAALVSSISTLFSVWALSFATGHRGPLPDRDAVGQHRSQPRRPRGAPGVRPARRPHRSQAGVHRRRARQRGRVRGLSLVDLLGAVRTRVRHRDPAHGRGL